MTLSLRDQLLGLGYQPAKPERKAEPQRGQHATSRPLQNTHRHQADATRSKAPQKAPQHSPHKTPVSAKRTQEEIDLAKAYALRAQKEKEDRLTEERRRQEEAQNKRQAKAKLSQIIAGKSQNNPNAELVRHFEYGGKIKRVHVTAEQLTALNAGELAVVQANGRYEIVPVTLLPEIESILPTAVALKVDPNAMTSEQDYSDPAHRVPDDLVW